MNEEIKPKIPQKTWQEKKISQGLCGTCGKRPLRTNTRCSVCTRAVDAANERAKFRKLHSREPQEKPRRFRGSR